MTPPICWAEGGRRRGFGRGWRRKGPALDIDWEIEEMISRLVLGTFVLSIAGLLPDLGMAHVVEPSAGGLAGGFAHPFAGLDHMVAMVVLGMWAAQGGRTTTWALPATFIGVVIVGFAAGFGGAPSLLVEAGIAGSVLVLGLLLAVGRPPLLAVGIALAAGFAVFHGYAHGTAAPTATLLPFAAGLALATASLHGIGVAAVVVGRRLWPTAHLARPLGALTAAVGVLLLVGF
jgi:urease accessory protein